MPKHFLHGYLLALPPPRWFLCYTRNSGLYYNYFYYIFLYDTECIMWIVETIRLFLWC